MDYTSVANVKAYGNITTATSDTLLAAAVTAVSLALDNYCHQAFSQVSYVAQQLRALVDQDGILTCYPAVPTIASISAAAYRSRPVAAWTTIDPTQLDIQQAPSGCTVRLFGQDLTAYRDGRLQVRLSYTAGWANLAAVPADFEWLTRRAVYWEIKKREAPMEKTAMPELGVVIVPQAWPPDLKQGFAPYVRQIPM